MTELRQKRERLFALREKRDKLLARLQAEANELFDPEEAIDSDGYDQSEQMGILRAMEIVHDEFDCPTCLGDGCGRGPDGEVERRTCEDCEGTGVKE